jgi:hypothetical protein
MSKKNIFLLVALHYCIVIFAQTQNNNGFLNSVDTDPNTLDIPNKRVIELDKGFYGMMTIQMGLKLKPMEKYELQYGKNKKIIVINTSNDVSKGYTQSYFTLRYPAKKLQKRPMVIFVEKVSDLSIYQTKLSEKISDTELIIIKND